MSRSTGSKLNLLAAFAIGFCFIVIIGLVFQNSNYSRSNLQGIDIKTSSIPVDENFESYVVGSNINGQGNWTSLATGSCTATIVNQFGSNWLQLFDDNVVAADKIEVSKALPGMAPRIGYATFVVTPTSAARNTTFLLSDGQWSEITPASPVGAIMVAIFTNGIQVLNGTTWTKVASAANNGHYAIGIYYKIITGWNLMINGTQYGGDFGYRFSFGQPRRMTIFEITTSGGSSQKNYRTSIDNLDFSWTPLTNAPVLSNGSVAPTTGTNGTFFTYSVTYTDADNNPAESVNVTVDLTQVYLLSKILPSDWNFTDGCMFSYTMVTHLTPGLHKYQFSCSDGTHVSMTAEISGPYVNIDPVANFTQNATAIKQGKKVQFTFTGSRGNPPANFSWNFNDGSPSSNQTNPVHQFNATGTFTITLLVTDSDGGTNFLAKPNLISVAPNLVPVPNFIANTTNVRTSSFVQFNYIGTDGDTPASFQWDFGDLSGNSTVRNPVHAYAAIGAKTVTVTVTDVDGDRGVMRKVNFITVSNNLIPVANFTSNVTSIYMRQSVQFNFTGFDGDAPANFQWNFGDGPTNASDRNPLHQYTSINNFDVTLLVIDNNGDASVVKHVAYITVLNRIPVANFTTNVTRIGVNKWVQFNFSGSQGDPVAGFEWSFGDLLGNLTDVDPKHQYTTAGNYTVILTVTDANGDKSVKKVINCIRVDANPLPIANFTANVTSAAALKPIQFTFTGFQGNGTALYSWDFGDGSTNATVQNPVHVYLVAGTYSINLTITDQTPNKNSMYKINYMTIRKANPPIVIDFTANATTIGRNSFVHFTFNGSAGGLPATFLWNFGDGSPPNASQNPIHKFTSINDYTITLSITDNDSNYGTGMKVNYIHVIDLLPLANFTANATRIFENGVIQFTFTGATGDLPVTFWWNFWDGSPGSNARNPIHQFTYQGNYSITLQVVDVDWNQSILTKLSYITVIKDLKPDASFTANVSSIIEGQIVSFVHTGSDGNVPATYEWNFGENATSNATVENPTHRYTAAGNYTVILTMVDSNGDASKVTQVRFITVVPNLIPVAMFSASKLSIIAGQSVQFNFTGFVGNAPATFTWDFGDNTPNGTAQQPSHVYVTAGIFNVTLIVRDANMDVNSSTRVNYITVIANLLPSASFSSNTTSIIAGYWVQFTFTGSEGNSPANFSWNFGDGSANSTVRNPPAHQFLVPGVYTITLTVIDANGDESKMIKTGLITVEANLIPTASFSASVVSIIAGQSITFYFTGVPGNSPAMFQWDFGDGKPNGTAQQPSHVYATAGIFDITLTVIDTNNDTNSSTRVDYITVIADLLPSASFSSNSTSIAEGDWVQFTFTGAEGNTPVKFYWNFGDGSANSTDRNPKPHQFSAPGSYTITLTVIDANGDINVKRVAAYIVVNAQGKTLVQILVENWWLLAIAAGGVVIALGAVVAVRKSRSREPNVEPILTSKEILSRLKHLFIFHRTTGTCIVYQPFSQTVFDPQLIAGFLSAITAFGSEIQEDAKLRVLEYQSFKILMEETEHCTFALLFEGDIIEQIKDLYHQFIFEFETKYTDDLAKFDGEVTPFRSANELIKNIFQAEKLPASNL